MFRRKVMSVFLLSSFLVPTLAFGQTTASVSGKTAAAPAPTTKVYSAPKATIDRIRDEGMNHSQVMQTLSYLTDVIGGRLTNSPNMKRANEWTRDKMKEWGMQNAHLESWGPFGRGWAVRKFSAAVVDPQFIPLISYPRAWSPSTKGVVTSEVVYLDAKTPEDLAKYKGQLRGKIVLSSAERALKPVEKAYLNRLTEEDLSKLAAAPQPKDDGDVIPAEALKSFTKSLNDGAKKLKFLSDEGAAVVIHNSGGGSGGTIFVDGANVGVETAEIKTIEELFESPAFQPQNKKYEANMLPQITMATEDYNRLV